MNAYIAAKAWLESESISFTATSSTASTNDDAKIEAFAISDELKIYLTDHQSAGRGRGENTWSNPAPGHSLMLTFSLHCEQAPQPITGPLMGLGIFRAMSEMWPMLPWSLKAPNDILLDGKKVCGILAETVSMGARYRLIVGMGINVLSSPEGISHATSISQHGPVDTDAIEGLMSKLVVHVQMAAKNGQSSQLTDPTRGALLQALNKNPNLEKNYVSITPAGDLVSEAGTLSWRSL